MKYLMPLLALVAIRQSHWKSKSVNSSTVIISPPLTLGTFLKIPSSTIQPFWGNDCFLKLRQPAVVCPSKRRRHPSAFSAGGNWFSLATARSAGRKKVVEKWKEGKTAHGKQVRVF